MKKSCIRVMSIILTVAMMLTLLPATLVFAETAPALTLSLVDGEGNAVSALYPGKSAYLRIGVSGIDQIYNMAAGVEATTAVFDTNLGKLNKKFAETGVLGDLFEINNAMQGAVVTATTARFKLTKISSVSPALLPTATTGFELVEIPFTVPAETAIGTEVTFAFMTGASDTNFYPASGATKRYTIGHATRPIEVNELTIAVTEEPYTITDLDIVPAFDIHPLGAEFPGFSGKTIRATMDMDRDGVPGMDTQDYEIVTDGPAEGKAYIDTASFNKDAMGTYTFDVVICDSTKKNAGGHFTKEDAVSVIVGPPVATGTVTANTGKVVEIKYGARAEDIKNAVAMRSDLFCDVMTDGSLEDTGITVNPTYIDATSFDGTIVGEQTVNVFAIDGFTVADGTIKVKVLPTTIASITLDTPWEAYPEMPAGTAFPGFGAREIVAVFDSATSYIYSTTFPISTNYPAEGKAYVDTAYYNAAAEGSYDLPVTITSSALEAPYEGIITLTVSAPAPTDKVRLTTNSLALENPEGDAATIVSAAEALVKATDGLFSTVLTNDETADIAAGVVATAVVSQYSEADKKVYVSISAVSGGKVLVGETLVTVDVNTDPTITGTVRVTDVTGEVYGFGSTIPAGAVITAIRLDDEGNGGNLHNGTYTSFYTITDENGAFELEVEPGAYKIHIAHSKYEYVEGFMYASRTIHEDFEAVVEDGEDLELGTVNLYYTYFGDTDVDGDVDGDDYGMFAPMMGAEIAR